MKFVLKICVGLFVLYSCKEKPTTLVSKPKENPPVNVDIFIASKQIIENKIELNGEVVANESVEIHPEISGKITYLNIPESKFVEAGTILAKINDAELQAQLSKIKIQLELAEINEKRISKLMEINAANQSDLDLAQNQIKSIKADINYQQSLIAKTIIKAPFNGVVGLRLISLGAYITPQTTIAKFQSNQQLKLDFNIPAKYISSVKIGNKVTVLIEGQLATLKATINAIEPDVQSNSQNIKIRCILNGKAAIGSFAKIILNVDKNKKSFFVPANAIIPEAKYKKLVLIKNNKAVFTNVETGLRTEKGVEITSGIQVGDSIIVVGVLFVRNNAPVKINSIKNLKELVQ